MKYISMAKCKFLSTLGYLFRVGVVPNPDRSKARFVSANITIERERRRLVTSHPHTIRLRNLSARSEFEMSGGFGSHRGWAEVAPATGEIKADQRQLH